MDQDRFAPKLAKQQSVDPPAGQFDAAGDLAKREVLAFAKKHSEKSRERKGV
jgi:hypothetical protein